MGRINEIWTPRHNAGLRAQFGMRGEAPAKQLAPEIQPTVELESVHWSPALQRAHQWHTFLASFALQGVVGQFSSIWIGVDNRDVICELTMLAINAASVLDIRQMPDPALASQGTVRDSDSRDPTFSQATPVPYPVILEGSNSVGGAGGGPQEAGLIQVAPPGLVLPVSYSLSGRAPSDPANGNGVLIQTNVFNAALSVTWGGRWRHVDPTERA